MKATDLKFNLLDSYLGLLKSLSPDNKLELISKLSDSLKGPQRQKDKSLSQLYGAFKTKKSAEDIIADLKMNRQFGRTTEEL